MALRKFTTLELNIDNSIQPDSEHLEKIAKLSDFEFKPEPGFLYVTSRAISSRVNANHDGWPPEELYDSYRTFIGKPVFVDHNNWDLNRSRGVILDAVIKEGKIGGQQETWVDLLIEVDAEAFPKLAQSIIDGDVDAVSMGVDVEKTICSVCDNEAHDVMQYCAHIPQMKGRTIETFDKTAGKKIKKLCFERCYGLNFFEISFVFEPADESALIGDKALIPKAASRTASHVRHIDEDIENYYHRVGMVKTADKQIIALPEPVDTLRDELDCPQCGNEWDGIFCISCGFEMPPEGLGDPATFAQRQQGTQDGQTTDDSSQDDSSNAKNTKKKSKEGGLRVSRFETFEKEATLPQDPPYRQDTSPANSVPPYGEAIPGGTPPTGGEPGLEPAPAAPATLQDLDAPDVQGPVGQSTVNVVNEQPGPVSTLPPGPAVGEQINVHAASVEEVEDEEIIKAAGTEVEETIEKTADVEETTEVAEEIEKTADVVTQTDVRNLDEPPAVDVGADATSNVTSVTLQPDQLALADTTDVINDGGETGIPAGPDFRERLPEQVNPFNDVALRPYAAALEAQTEQRIAAEKTRVLRIANFVDERIEMGLSDPGQKFAEIARFEEMEDAALDGYIQATREFKAHEVKTASKRIRVASVQDEDDTNRLPSLGSAPKIASIAEQFDPADDYVAFI